MLQNKQYCVNWSPIEMVMQYLSSSSVIKPLKRCNSASINLGNTLHTLNRGKLSPESFASSFNLRSDGDVFKQHHQPPVPSLDRPRFTARKATTVVGRWTKPESHSRLFCKNPRGQDNVPMLTWPLCDRRVWAVSVLIPASSNLQQSVLCSTRLGDCWCKVKFFFFFIQQLTRLLLSVFDLILQSSKV